MNASSYDVVNAFHEELSDVIWQNAYPLVIESVLLSACIGLLRSMIIV